MTDWYNYDNKVAITFPPIGSEVIVSTRNIKMDFWPENFQVKVVGVDGDNVLYKYQGEYYADKLYEFIPVDIEAKRNERKLMNEVADIVWIELDDITYEESKEITKHLYELGYLKFPEEK